MFSVIINNYNYAGYIAAAIESVLAQTLENFELIIVDDGSKDGSREVIDRYDDDRIKLVYKENGGQASALNAGIEKAEGEWLCFLDSDDVWSGDKLEQIEKLTHEVDASVVLITHDMDGIDTEGNPLKSGDRKVPSYAKSKTMDALKWIKITNTLPPFCPTSSLIIKRSALMSHHPIEEDKWIIAADVPLIIHAALEGGFYYYPKSLSYYRIHGENGWVSNTAKNDTTQRSLNLNFKVYNVLQLHIAQIGKGFFYNPFLTLLAGAVVVKGNFSKLVTLPIYLSLRILRELAKLKTVSKSK